MPNYGWRQRSKCIFDSDIRFEFRRIRDIRVRDIESRLYISILHGHCFRQYRSNFRYTDGLKYFTRLEGYIINDTVF